MTTGLYLLRCAELGLTVADLDLLTFGTVLDMFTERINDASADEYARQATQADFDSF